MLVHLSVKNIALIDEVTLNFSEGFNVLTGETGAGKSIIIDAVNLVLGERADRDLIQAGKDSALVEALFNISGQQGVACTLDGYGIPIEADGSLVLARELSVSGKNLCRINGRIVTLSTLKDVSRKLVDIHGQHQHQSLLSVNNQRDLLDMLGGDSIASAKEEVEYLYKQWREIDSRIKKLTGTEMDEERRKDILTYQINEIKSANLKDGEEEELDRELRLLANGEKIVYGINKAYELLYSGDNIRPSGTDILGQALEALEELVHIDEAIDPIKRGLETLTYELEDVVFNLRAYMDEFEYDPYRINELQERLEVIRTIKRKYGRDIHEIRSYLEDIEEELNTLVNSRKVLEELYKEEKIVFQKLTESSEILSGHRREMANLFETYILEQLEELGMEMASFRVNLVTPGKDAGIFDIRKRVTDKGYDEIEFLISTNPGQPLKSLSKVVSGGEMSRIMLAFKTILAKVDDIPTMIFDEIDAGISGHIAHVVGEKMGRISMSRQIICVTHLPQIAAMADMHYRIEKEYKDGHTRTRAYRLSDKEQLEEIAKMAGGEGLSEAGLKHSSELVQRAESYKKEWVERFE